MSRSGQQQHRDGDWIIVGMLGGSHGVRGDVRVRSFTERPDQLFGFDDLRRGADRVATRFTAIRPVKDGFLARIDGVDSREAAQSLAGQPLFVPRAGLGSSAEDDDFYLVDLIGLEARDPSGERLGTVRGVDNFGAEDLLDLDLDTSVKGLGRTVYVPFRRVFVPDVAVARGWITVDLSAWLASQFGGGSVEKGVPREGDADAGDKR